MRHGKTRWNEEGKVQGREDLPLSKDGVKEVLKRRPVFEDHRFSHVYVSPLTRALETERLLLSKSRVDALDIEEGLTEYDFKNKEDVQDYLKRIVDVLIRVSPEDGNILLITHGNVIADLLRALNPDFKGLIENLSVSAVENTTSDGTLTLRFFGHDLDDTALRELLSRYDSR